MKTQKEIPIIPFQTQKKWRDWLTKNFDKPDGIWLKLYKKDSGVKSINHGQALEEALCFGWIDGQAKGYDDLSYLQKFTPRRKRSTWSKRNIDIIERLAEEGKMHPAGIAEVERAKEDGRWELAYDSPANMQAPEDFLKKLADNPKALAFYSTLNKTNTFAISFRLQTAKKPKTRQKRMMTIIEMLEQGKKLH
jgi:uncharacterized protein YdeI (YjbR/CyaY-like superfamily)